MRMHLIKASHIGEWRNWLAHTTDNREVVGSIPTSPTNLISPYRAEVACQAHNLKVVGSNPTTATIVLLVESRYNTVGFDSPMDAD